MFKKKCIFTPKDLRIAKLIFFRHNGNSFFMWKNGALQEYERFCVPKETEKVWLEEIFQDHLNKIKTEKNNEKLVLQISSLITLEVHKKETIDFINAILDTRIMDTFSYILVCEELKRIIKYSKSSEITALIKNKIIKIYTKLIRSPITISDEYKLLSYMQDYDFSEENIRKRISDLIDFS